MQYVAFSIWLLSLGIMVFRFIYTVARVRTSFLFIVEWYSIGGIYHICVLSSPCSVCVCVCVCVCTRAQHQPKLWCLAPRPQPQTTRAIGLPCLLDHHLWGPYSGLGCGPGRCVKLPLLTVIHPGRTSANLAGDDGDGGDDGGDGGGEWWLQSQARMRQSPTVLT